MKYKGHPVSILKNITCDREGMTVLKYTEDMALVAHLTDINSLVEYQQCVANIAEIFQENSLKLNIKKTKKLWGQVQTWLPATSLWIPQTGGAVDRAEKITIPLILAQG